MLDPFRFAFVQEGVYEVLLLSVAAGLLGTWIVLRGLAFYSHAVGTAAFPGLVVAEGLALPAPLGAFVAALAFAFGVERLARTRRAGYDSLTALVLVGALALGVVLASDVFHSGSNIETLLFGSLLLIGTGDLVLAGVASALALACTALLGRRWLALGFDPASAGALGLRSFLPDAVLVALVALAIVAALAAIGALLATALFVIPAATTRLWTNRLRRWQAATVALVAVEGVCGLWLSVRVNVPPGAAISVLAGAVFALGALARWAPSGRRPYALAGAGALAAALLVLAGCAGAAKRSDGQVHVVATTTQIGDWVRVVGGDAVTVTQLLQPNTDPHDYEPRPADVEAAAGAKLVLESGDGLDAWMAKVVSESGASPTVVDLGARVPVKLPGTAEGAEASRYDPHWWHDPRNVEEAVGEIRAALATADPSARSTFAANADAYLERLEALDRSIRSCLARIPVADRTLVTDHDAFDYFAKRYGLEVVGAVIPSQTTQAQPSAGATAKLVDLIRRTGVKAVFPESSLNARLARAIANDTGATAAFALYGDTLGPEGSPGATYLGMEQANANAIARGLSGGASGCTIPGIG